MTDLTSRIIGRVLFGADMTAALPQIVKFRFVNDAILQRGLPRIQRPCGCLALTVV